MSSHQVVAAVIVDGDRVLLCHRRPDLPWYPDVWDLPGGHIEPGETAATALARELAEELGIEVPTPAGPPMLADHIGSDTHITVWAIDRWHGTVTNQAPDEHDRIAWFTPAELNGLELADEAIVEVCKAASSSD